jgi:hypothetical protein
MQSLSSEQAVQVPALVSQTGVDPVHNVWLVLEHSPHEPSG